MAYFKSTVSKQKLTDSPFIAEKSELCKGKTKLIKVGVTSLLQCMAYSESTVSKLI
jgi:hypothetical protein